MLSLCRFPWAFDVDQRRLQRADAEYPPVSSNAEETQEQLRCLASEVRQDADFGQR